MKPVSVEAVTVCVNYPDFLNVTSKINQSLFDRWVIVTSERDEETIEVCRKRSLKCLTTEDFYAEGGFNKGRGVQRGIDQLSNEGWVLHIDADIVLPPDFRQWLGAAELKKDCIHGFDRIMVRGWHEWKTLYESGFSQHDYHCRINFPKNLPVGSRWGSLATGWVPIGYAQLWWGPDALRRGHYHKPYPDYHSDASRSDVKFALQWDRPQRVLVPELTVVHLDSEVSELGANWNGRKTRRFEEPKPEPRRVDCGLGAS